MSEYHARTRMPTLVLGGTGKTGRRLVQRLSRMDLPVRIGSRSAGVPFDWQRPQTWGPVLEGVGAVYISYQPDLTVPGALEAISSFAAQAVASGVRRLVLLSGRGEPEAQAGEQAVSDTGADLTVLSCSWFNQNFSENYLVEPVQAGEFVLPAGDVGEPWLDADDVADVAAAVLTQDGHVGRTYELTGPRLLTCADAVAVIAGATGRDIKFTSVDSGDFSASMAAAGVPETDIQLPGLPVHYRPGRTQRLPGRRRGAGAGTGATGLRRLRPRHRRHRRVGPPMTTPAASFRNRRRTTVDRYQALSLAVATLCTGLMTGVFFSYANAVMPGLGRTDDRTFDGSFQQIDRAIINPLFMLVFVGTLVVTGLAALSLLRGDGRSALPWAAAALVLYALAVVLTMTINVPLNNGIKAAGDPDRIADLAAVRARFNEARWVFWNLVRTVASAAAFACLIWALVLHGRAP